MSPDALREATIKSAAASRRDAFLCLLKLCLTFKTKGQSKKKYEFSTKIGIFLSSRLIYATIE